MSILVDPTIFLEWVDWNKPPLTESEKRILRQIRRRDRYERLGIDFIDRILTRAGEPPHRLEELYPLGELTCRHGHPVTSYYTRNDGKTVCRDCANWNKRQRRSGQGELFDNNLYLRR